MAKLSERMERLRTTAQEDPESVTDVTINMAIKIIEGNDGDVAQDAAKALLSIAEATPERIAERLTVVMNAAITHENPQLVATLNSIGREVAGQGPAPLADSRENLLDVFMHDIEQMRGTGFHRAALEAWGVAADSGDVSPEELVEEVMADIQEAINTGDEKLTLQAIKTIDRVAAVSNESLRILAQLSSHDSEVVREQATAAAAAAVVEREGDIPDDISSTLQEAFSHNEDLITGDADYKTVMQAAKLVTDEASLIGRVRELLSG